MTDEELVMQLKAGQREAFDELYARYRNLAVRSAYLITGNLSDAEDVAQEAFVTSYLHIGELKNYGGYKAWLMQILVRLSYRTVKRSKREVQVEELTGAEETDNAAAQSPPPSSPLMQLISREEADRIMEAVNKLPIKQRIVTVLYYYHELSIEEIAVVVRTSAGTVKSRLFTARKNLKNLLGGNYE